jgi:hypothetical protein
MLMTEMQRTGSSVHWHRGFVILGNVWVIAAKFVTDCEAAEKLPLKLFLFKLKI